MGTGEWEKSRAARVEGGARVGQREYVESGGVHSGDMGVGRVCGSEAAGRELWIMKGWVVTRVCGDVGLRRISEFPGALRSHSENLRRQESEIQQRSWLE